MSSTVLNRNLGFFEEDLLFLIWIQNRTPSAPLKCCKTCVEILQDWSNKKRKSMSFGVSIMWRKGSDHTTDRYFCLTNLEGCNHMNKYHVKYPDVPSITKLVLHSSNLLVLKSNVTKDIEPTSLSIKCCSWMIRTCLKKKSSSQSLWPMFNSMT